MTSVEVNQESDEFHMIWFVSPYSLPHLTKGLEAMDKCL